jgi:hypothetical protein
VSFDFREQESKGTQRLFKLSGPWLEVLEKGYCYSTLKSLIFDKSSPFFTKISFISSEIFASSAVSLDTTKSSIPISANSLHPKLVAYLVSMFHNPEINKHGAQLIFVTHETSLLNQDTLCHKL